MNSKDVRTIIKSLVDGGKIEIADSESAKVLADNLPANTILHYAGENAFLVDAETGSIFRYDGDMEDWSYSEFDLSEMERTDRSTLVKECLMWLKAAGFHKSLSAALTAANNITFGGHNG